MVQLKTLEIQLKSLMETLEKSKRHDRPLEEINEIIGRIKIVEILIEKRKAYIRRNQSLN